MGICAAFTCSSYTKLYDFFLPHRYHFAGRDTSKSKEPRFRLLEIEANAVMYIHKYRKICEKSWILLQATHAGWSRTRPKLVCCEACWWRPSNDMSCDSKRTGIKSAAVSHLTEKIVTGYHNHINTDICLALVLRYQCLCKMKSLFVFGFASLALYNTAQLVTKNILMCSFSQCYLGNS